MKPVATALLMQAFVLTAARRKTAARKELHVHVEVHASLHLAVVVVVGRNATARRNLIQPVARIRLVVTINFSFQSNPNCFSNSVSFEQNSINKIYISQ